MNVNLLLTQEQHEEVKKEGKERRVTERERKRERGAEKEEQLKQDRLTEREREREP